MSASNNSSKDIHWNLDSSGSLTLYQYSTGGATITFYNNGSVGIGTTNPDPINRLEVRATGYKTAISGLADSGIGVGGSSGGGNGVQGNSATGMAVYGLSTRGIGVVGDGPIGVQGGSTLGTGVRGQVYGDQNAVLGVSGNQSLHGLGAGVAGVSFGGPGVGASSIEGYGVEVSSVRSWCGYFHSLGDITNTAKGVYISVPAGQPGLQVASGTKNAVVATSQGTRALHTEESTAVWFTDYGFGHLQAGHVVVSIDPLFSETVNLSEPYHVFIQLNDADAEGVAVVNKTASSFEVVELRNGHSNAEFSYRLVAKRRGYEQNRLEQTPWADDDPNLYPEKRSAWEAQQRLRRPEVSQIEIPPHPPEMP